jgi:hypothetical protein
VKLRAEGDDAREETKEDVRVESALVRLVDDQRRVLSQRKVALRGTDQNILTGDRYRWRWWRRRERERKRAHLNLFEEDAVRHELDPRRVTHIRVVADLQNLSVYTSVNKIHCRTAREGQTNREREREREEDRPDRRLRGQRESSIRRRLSVPR